jgi:hypothetical protein
MPPDKVRPPAGNRRAEENAPIEELSSASVPQPADDARDAAVTRVTPKTPAERARKYRKLKRDALTDALVTPATVTPVTPDLTIQPVIPAVGMTKGERDELTKITRQRGRVAKAQAEAVKAELLADVEAKLSAEFSAEDEMWREANKIADQAEREANAVIAQRCDEMGIPAAFRPHRRSYWLPRGDNLDPSRRAELRKLAAARVDHIAKTAKLKIEAQESDVLTQLYAGGLTSEAAREFLAKMPDPRALMPTFEVADLEAEYDNRKSIGSR